MRGRPSISHTLWAAMCVRRRAAGRERQMRARDPETASRWPGLTWLISPQNASNAFIPTPGRSQLASVGNFFGQKKSFPSYLHIIYQKSFLFFPFIIISTKRG